MTNKILEQLSDELEAFCKTCKLPFLSADDLIAVKGDTLSGWQKMYLSDFDRRWERAQDSAGFTRITVVVKEDECKSVWIDQERGNFLVQVVDHDEISEDRSKEAADESVRVATNGMNKIY